MIRNLLSRLRVGAFCVGACLVMISPHSWGMGLGEIELDSALNEKLRAEIELLDASGLQPSEILVSLASNDDFERIGVERFFFLTDLRFQVTYGAGGRATVAVTSSQPVTEPYLNFLVEVLWPNGRLLKEYTLLLDPPTFSQAAAPAVSAPRQADTPSQTAGRVSRPDPARSGTQVQMTPPAQRPARSPLDNELMTDRQDTLWAIASRTRPSASVSVQQNMLAIQRLNPEAFINNNINLLKAGYVLRLPSDDQARSLSAGEAVAAVATQNEEWRAYTRGERPAPRQTAPAQVAAGSGSELQGQVDATAGRTTGGSDATISEGELRIVAGTGDSATGTAAQANPEDLNAALEEQDRLGREVDELTYQLDREQELAKNQLEVKDRQLEVKDQQIAELQAQMAELQKQISERPQNQNQSTSAPAPSEPWWQSPYVMGGAVGVLVLALVGGLIVARRNRDTDDEFYPADDAMAEERLEPEVTAEAGAYVDDEPEGAGEDDDSQEDAVGDHLDEDEELQGSQTGDVIGEADIYIAYGRYPQAIGLLLSVLEDDPDRNDVRLKLLELFVETNDEQAFETHMAELVNRCDDEDALLAAREFEARLGENDLELGQTIADAEPAADVDRELDALGTVDDFDLDLDLDSSAAKAADSDAGVADQPDAATAGGSLSDEDFELELDDSEDLTSGADASPEGGAGDELGGDLGIDFNPEREPEPESAGAATAAADDGAEVAFASEQSAVATSDTTLTTKTSALDDIEFESEVATVEEDEFDFEDEGDSANTKLDLARAYIDMGDAEGARDILKEVLDEGNSDQQQQAKTMLEGL